MSNTYSMKFKTDKHVGQLSIRKLNKHFWDYFVSPVHNMSCINLLEQTINTRKCGKNKAAQMMWNKICLCHTC